MTNAMIFHENYKKVADECNDMKDDENNNLSEIT